MPSASAKIEKVASVEAVDPVKQMVILMEKKVRNLEKRKLKLDNYKSDVRNGKELNEDQKIAVSKYDAVVEHLEFAKELSKSCGGIIQEFARQQKKLAKKEQIEKQQHEIHRLHEVFSMKYLLERLESKDVSNDFLNGINGAIKIASEDLAHLSMLYKLIESNLPNEQADVESHFHSLAEHLVFLLEGKNKEVVGTTYKNLKELLQSIKDCGYFSRTSAEEEEEEEEEEATTVVENVPQLDEELNVPDSVDLLGALGAPVELAPVNGEINAHVLTDADKTPAEQGADEISDSITDKPASSQANQSTSFSVQNGPLQEVLSSEGSFNFLQESQIDLESPHMDPAVVAVHQMAPPPTVNFNSYSAPQPRLEEEINNPPDVDSCEVPVQNVQQQIPVLASTRTIAPLLTSVQHNTPHDFDPSHPIPTQTFTNQSYAVMQNMIMPQAYVPVTMHHGPMPPHIAPIAVVPGLSPATATVTTTATVPMHVTVAPVTTTAHAVTLASDDSKMPAENFESQPAAVNGSSSGNDTDGSQNEASIDRGGNDSEGFTTPNNYRGGGGYRGRGRGRAPYYRGRNNYNGSRGGYQGHNNYYQNGNSFRRGNPRGGPRGPINSRGRGNTYRSQSTQQQQK